MIQTKFASARIALQRIALVSLAAGLALNAAAQPTPAPAPAPTATAKVQTPPFNGIAHIAIQVHSVADSLAFYNKLGFQQAFANTAPDGTITQSFLKINDRQFIELYPVTAHDPDAGFLHLCFEGADLNALHDFYVAEGLAPKPVRTAAAGNLLFTLAGPQQPAFPQNIEYTQYMPDSRHSKDIGLHLSPDRVADKMLRVALSMNDPEAARDFYLIKLGFTAMPNGRMWLVLPGNSGQQILITPAYWLNSKAASVVLTTSNIDRSVALLTQQKVDFKRIPSNRDAKPTDGDSIAVTDPDGNKIIVADESTQAAYAHQ
jgi:catechol 2,3-dioxygenase-like lactoylglutathione lyase family enzyme